MSNELCLRDKLQDHFSELKLALEVLERARQGAGRAFIVEWLDHFERSTDKCISMIDQINRSAFDISDAYAAIPTRPVLPALPRARLRIGGKAQRNQKPLEREP